MAFPDDADLGTMVELDLGGTWTDITSRTRLAQTITITRGRADYASTVDPTQVRAQVRNTDGALSPGNPTGPYYGKLTRNTPLRTSIAAGTPWLDLPPSGTDVRASTPSTSALNITGDLDVRFDVQAQNWDDTSGVVELGGKWGSAGQQSWQVYLFAGSVRFVWTTDGSTQLQAAAPLQSAVHPRRMVIRVTLDVNNGAGSHVVQFWTSTSMTGTWTQIGGDNVVSGTAGTFASTAPVEFGDLSSTGTAHSPARLFAVQVRSGINGTLVASPDFTAQTSGATTFTDSVGVPWTINRTTGITNRSVRGTGEVPSWPNRWGTSGQIVTADIAASGILRRLRQGGAALDSTLRRCIASDANVVAYWPLEDGTGATQGYSPLPGIRPMVISGGPQMASDDTLAGSLALPTWPQGSHFAGSVPPVASSTSWQVQCVFRVNSSPASYTNLLVITGTGTVQRWEIAIESAGVRIRGLDATGTIVVDSPWGPLDVSGPWTRLKFTASQSGSNIAWSYAFIVVGQSSLTGSGTVAGTVGAVSGVHQTYIAGLDTLRLGHVAVFSDANDSAFDYADTAFNGDSVDARVTRLAGEERVPLLTPYGPAGTMLLGPQNTDTLLTLLQAATDADVGILYEPRDQIALAARPRVSLYNQTPALILDYAQQQVAPPLEPEDDDSATRNDITVSRASGSSARATLTTGALSTQDPPAGVGRYSTSATLNLYDDSQPEQVAGWLLHLGTYDGVRYPSVTVFLHRNPELIDAAREVDIGDRLQILNLPVWLPPGGADLIVQGVTEVIGIRTWTMTFVCTPAGPWTVGVVGDNVLGRADTGGSQLAAAATATDNVLSIATASGSRLWTTSLDNYPFDLMVGGEQVTALAVGCLNPNPTFEQDTAGWTPVSCTLDRISPGHTGSWAARIITNGGSNPRGESTGGTVTAGARYRAVGWLYAPQALPSGAQVNVNWFNGTGTYLSTSSSSSSITPGVWTHFDTTVTAPTGATRGDVLFTIPGTPAAGLELRADEVMLVPLAGTTTSPQPMTVVRSVNGISKAQTTGTAVTLATGAVVAL